MRFKTDALKQGGTLMKDTANRLLKLAGALMLIASAVLALLKQRLPVALLAVGALGCIVSGMNFKRRQD